MKKHILISFLLFAVITLISFSTAERDKKYIYWDDRRELTWEDFKGRGPSGSPYVALTHSAIKMAFGGEGKEVWFTIETIFDPKQSWKKKNIDNHVLKHEQGHFDLTEVYSRMLRKELSETKFKKYENVSADVQKIFTANFKACDKIQDLYDKETDHSKIKEEQLRWNEAIDSMLNSLSAFSETEFKIDVSYLLE